MVNVDSPHMRFQQQIDCQLETTPIDVLKAWEKSGWQDGPGEDIDEAPLKYMALVFLDAVEDRALRYTVDREEGVTVFGETTRTLPKAPSHIIARGLEIIREISGLDAGNGQATLSVGVRNDSVEVILQKEKGLHVFNIPGIV
jgi:hypothetical protein